MRTTRNSNSNGWKWSICIYAATPAELEKLREKIIQCLPDDVQLSPIMLSQQGPWTGGVRQYLNMPKKEDGT